MMNIRDKEILHLAIPSIVTNVTVPLLGLVDLAIVGHIGNETLIGAIAVGSMIFNVMYWLMGFLRMGTSGMTAQAFGQSLAANNVPILAILRRNLLVAVAIAVAFVVLQTPLQWLSLWLMEPSEGVASLVRVYFNICIWGAPAVLSLYVMTGWFIGMQDTRTPMVVSIAQNIINIVVSLVLVFGFGMKIEGVALGTLGAQWSGAVMAFFGVMLKKRQLSLHEKTSETLKLPAFSVYSKVNIDLFLRTLFMVAVNLFFTSAGARQGDLMLSVNTLLMTFFMIFSYIMDGFAFAGEALGGRYWGAANYDAFHAVVRRLFVWGVGMTVLFTAVYVLGGMPFLRLLTDEPGVVDASRQYVWWAYLVPAAGVAAFVWDGVFIGITQTRGMLWSSCIAALLFFAVILLLVPQMGNHGLWLAMVLYLLARGLVQSVIYWQRYLIIDNR